MYRKHFVLHSYSCYFSGPFPLMAGTRVPFPSHVPLRSNGRKAVVSRVAFLTGGHNNAPLTLSVSGCSPKQKTRAHKKKHTCKKHRAGYVFVFWILTPHLLAPECQRGTILSANYGWKNELEYCADDSVANSRGARLDCIPPPRDIPKKIRKGSGYRDFFRSSGANSAHHWHACRSHSAPRIRLAE